MAKSKGRLLAELLASDGKVKESKSALDITGGKLAPSDIPTLPNSKLENSSISIAGHNTALGGSVTLNTGDIGEHTNYKYHTEARVRGSISATGSLSYNSTTGVMSFTMPAQNTSNITEGSNKYYTDARVGSYLSTNGYATQSTIVGAITDSAPGTLDTLNELAAALGDDANFSTTVTNSIATKLPLAGGTITGTTKLNDNIVLQFGTGADGSIHHDGSHFRLRAATGNFNIQTDDFHITDKSNTTVRFAVDADGATDIRYNGVQKLVTTNTGIDVTGTVNGDAVSINGTTVIDASRALVSINHITSGGDINTTTGGFEINGTTVIDSSRNLTNIGTISSGAITSTATQATLRNSSGVTLKLTTNGSPGSVSSKLPLHIDFNGYGQTPMARIRSWDESSSTADGFLEFYTNNYTGSHALRRVLLLDNDRNATFDGTISSGAITTSGVITANGTSGSSFYGITLTRSSSGTTTPDLWGSSGTLVIGTSSSDEVLGMSGTAATFYGTLASGTFTSSGDVRADTHFNSTDTNATLSATGSGNVYLRPNGKSSTSGQVHIATSGNATFTGNIVAEDSEVHVGDTSGDSWTRIKHAGADGYGFDWQHDNATVIVNEQGSTNQVMVLGDVDAANYSGLFGIAHSTNSGTSWIKKLDLKGNGELYIGSSGTNQVYHEGHKPTYSELGTMAYSNLTGTPTITTLSNGANNRIVTAGGVSSINAEANLQYDGSALDIYTGSIAVTDNHVGLTFRQTGSYSDGRYEHRFRKRDEGGGIPLYIDKTSSTANAHTAIARFGSYTSNPEEFQVYGKAKVTDLHIKSGTSGTNTQGLLFTLTDNADAQAYIKKSAYYMHYNAHYNEGHRFTVNGTDDMLRMHGSNNSTRPDSIDILAANGLYMNNTQVMTQARALTNVTTATAGAGTNTTALANTAFVQQEITSLIGGAPGTLDTLNELAAAINDDHNYNSTLTTALATKLPKAGGTMTGVLNMGVKNITNADDIGMITGHSSGKFAVMATSVHGSYDFYNNGTSYFNGTVTVDANLTLSGGGQILGSPNITAGRVVTSGLYGIGHGSSTLPIWQYNAGNPGYGIAYTESSPDVLRFDVSSDLMSGTADLELRPNDLRVNGSTVWNAGNDGSGSGLDADTVDGYDVATTGANKILRTDGNNYIQLANWINIGTTGLYSGNYGNHFHVENNGYIARSGSSTVSQIRLQTNDSSTTTRGYVYANSNNYIGFLDNGASWLFQARSNGQLYRGNGTGLIWDSANDGSGSGLDADNLDGVTWATQTKAVAARNLTIEAGDGQGIGFWGGTGTVLGGSYAIAMASQGNGNAGRHSLDSTSDYNMYFKMSGGTDRGFVFKNSGTNVAAITKSGRFLGSAVYLDGSSSQNQYVAADSTHSLTVRNMGATGAGGLVLQGSSGTHGLQMYWDSDGAYYGFLDAAWASWDIQKARNGAFKVDEGNGLQRVWNAGNDGSGSGLDADLLDGQHGSYYRNAGNINAGTLPIARIPTSVMRATGTEYNSATNWSSGIFPLTSDNVLTWSTVHNSTSSWGDSPQATFSTAYTYGGVQNVKLGSMQIQTYYPHSGSAGNGVYYRTGWESSGSSPYFHTWAKFYDTNNDGSGSGLDADLLDGQHGSYYYSSANPPPTYSKYLRSDQDDTVTAGVTYTFPASDSPALISTRGNGGASLYVGGWSNGANSNNIHRISSSSNLHIDSAANGNLYLNYYRGGTTYIGGANVAWHAGNDGSGSGLDADFLDGYNAEETAVNNSIVKRDGNAMITAKKLYLNGGNYEGQIIFGAVDAWRTGIRQHDDGDAEMRIWAKNANGRIHIATGYDGQPASITRPTDGFVVDHNNVGIGNFSGVDPSQKLHVKGSVFVESGNLHLGNNAGLTSTTTGEALRVLFPGGGARKNNGSSETGAIKVTLPVGMTNSMLSFKITVYQYNTDDSFEVHVGGYNYPTGNTWTHNPFGYITSSPKANHGPYAIRFGLDSNSKACVYIGETNTTWSYPQIAVTEALIGYAAYTNTSWDDGWDVSIATSFENVTHTIAATDTSTVGWHPYNDGSGSGLDADLLDGQHGSYYQNASNINSGTLNTARLPSAITVSGEIRTTAGALQFTSNNHVLTTSSAHNPLLKSGGSGAMGLLGQDSGSNFRWQLYGDGSNYGFLDGNWANWDIKKARNGELYVDAGSGLQKVWHQGNDGSGSGLDADLLDGLHASSFLRLDSGSATPQVVPANRIKRFSSQAAIDTTSGSQSSLEVYGNNGAGTDAFMTFHVENDYALYFGLDGGTNKLSVGGWSAGAASYEIYHAGNKPSLATLGFTGASNANYITNNNQLTNGAGYITASGNAATSHAVTGSAFATTSSPSSVLEYQQASGQSDTRLAPSGDWHNTIRMGHGNPYNYYSNTLAARMTGTYGDWYTQTIYNNSPQGWRKIWNSGNDGSGSTLDADLLDGLDLHTGRNNEANKVVRTEANGYIQAGYINTNVGVEALSHDWTRVYASTDGYIRPIGKSDFKVRMGLTAHEYDRMDYATGTQYHTGANSHNDTTFNGLLQRGCGFIDNWNGGAGKPPTGSHWNGFQALHYGNGSSYFHGMQMAMAAGNPSNTFLRGWWANGGSGYGWQKIWTDGNDGSGSGLDADLLDGLDSASFLRSDVHDTAVGLTINGGTLNSPTDSTLYVTASNNNDWGLTIGAASGKTEYGMQIQMPSSFNYALRILKNGSEHFNVNSTGATIGGNYIWHAGNDGSGSGLDADLLDGYHRTQINRYQSGSDFANGTLVTTNINSGGQNGDSFVIEISGKAYGSSRPHTVVAEGYIYNNTIINTNGSNIGGSNFTYLKVMNISGNLCFWWPRHGYWNSYDVFVRSSSSGTSNYNRVTAIANSADPSNATKKIQINLATSWTSANDGAGSGLDADLLDGNQASAFLTTSGKAADSNLLDGIDSTYFNRGTNAYGVFPGSSGHNLNDVFTGSSYNRAGFIDSWSGSNFPPGTTHIQGIQVRHNSGNHYGWQLFGQYNQQGKLFHRQVSNGSWGSWSELWNSNNDGSGSGLDADLLDGLNSAENGNDIVLRTNSNGYLNLLDWVNVGGEGIYSSSVNGAHWYPNTAGSYGVWRINGSRGGYSGIYHNNGGGVVSSMYDSGGNGGDWNGTNGWQFYWHRSNSCLAVAGSTTSSTYSLYVGGQIYATSNITAYSDRRVKENIIPIDNALEKVNDLQGVYYNRIDDEDKTKEIGFIAQEVNEVVPELVTYAEDIDQYGVKYGNTTALLVEAVKELTQQVKDLKQEIEEIKNVK